MGDGDEKGEQCSMTVRRVNVLARQRVGEGSDDGVKMGGGDEKGERACQAKTWSRQ